MTDLNKLLDKEYYKELWANKLFLLKLLLLIILISFSFLLFLTKSSKEIEGKVISINLIASQGMKNYNRVFIETPNGFKGIVKTPQYTGINIGDKILCEQIENYMGATRFKFVKKL